MAAAHQRSDARLVDRVQVHLVGDLERGGHTRRDRMLRIEHVDGVRDVVAVSRVGELDAVPAGRGVVEAATDDLAVAVPSGPTRNRVMEEHHALARRRAGRRMPRRTPPVESVAPAGPPDRSNTTPGMSYITNASNSAARSGRTRSSASGCSTCSHSTSSKESNTAKNASASNGCPFVTTATRGHR